MVLNRDLIDPNFAGYKLSLDSLPTYCFNIGQGVDAKQLESNEFYSYQHIRAFGIQNHLFLDPWNDDSFWIVDEKWSIRKAPVSKESEEFSYDCQFEIPDSSERQLTPDRINVTLHFTDPHWSIVSDGTGWMYILKTGDRLQNERWKSSYGGQPLGESKRFVILNSTLTSVEKLSYLEVLCLHVDKCLEQPENPSTSAFATKLEWLTFTSGDENDFVLSRTRTLKSSDVPDYAVLQGSSIIVACRKPVSFVFDSLKTIECIKNDEEISRDDKPAQYTWTQDDEEVTVTFKLSPETQKDDICCTIEAKRLDLRIQSSQTVLLSGDFVNSVKADESTWLISDGSLLELHLIKVVSGETWDNVVDGNNSGQFVLDPEQLSAINERLAPFTSDDVLKPDPNRPLKSFNVQQLEECDELPEESASIWQLDGETHGILQQVDISSYQWLFCGTLTRGSAPPLCLRHDVDGVVWQPEVSPDDGSLAWRHVSTFNAFGYVQASKQERKFTVNAPNFSFVAIADFVRHVFVYHQPSTVKNTVRNRKTGEAAGTVAKQRVVSLESVDLILGVQASNERLFVLTRKAIYVVRVADLVDI